MKQTYTKQPLSIDDQIALLQSRGLNITDEASARRTLEEISYFRLAAYLRPMEQDKAAHTFKPSATFENALALYEFDGQLRQLLFASVQRLEIALRTRMIQRFSAQHGPFWFMEPGLFKSESNFQENLAALEREVRRSKEDFIHEYYAKYDQPALPPVWKTLELATLGTLSKLYCDFANNKVKKQAARDFNLPQHEVLESWARMLTGLRNHCAHHSRLWNRRLSATPQLTAKMRGAWIARKDLDANKLYAALCCLLYWLNSLGRGEKFKSDLLTLLSAYPNVDLAAMGFPNGWEEEPLWREGLCRGKAPA